MSHERKPPDEDEDDAALFRSAIGPVRELPPADAPPPRPKPRPGTRMGDLDEAEARAGEIHSGKPARSAGPKGSKRPGRVGTDALG